MFKFFKMFKENDEKEIINRQIAIQELMHSYVEKNKELRKEQEELNKSQKQFNNYVLERLNEEGRNFAVILENDAKMLNRHMKLLETMDQMKTEMDDLKMQLKQFIDSDVTNGNEVSTIDESDLQVEEKANNYYEKELDTALSFSMEERRKLWKEVVESFNGRCMLTGSSNVTLSHFIPLIIGHGGTVKENVFPIDSNLLESKGNKNPFDWAKTQNLDTFRWKELVNHLAALSGLTPIEYENFVNWCFENPNDLEDIKEKGLEMSIRTWNNQRRKRNYYE